MGIPGMWETIYQPLDSFQNNHHLLGMIEASKLIMTSIAYTLLIPAMITTHNKASPERAVNPKQVKCQSLCDALFCGNDPHSQQYFSLLHAHLLSGKYCSQFCQQLGTFWDVPVLGHILLPNHLEING